MDIQGKYKDAFSVLEPPADLTSKVLKEAENMESNKTYKPVRARRLKPLISIAAALVLVFSLAAVSYASDLGGFRRTVNIWLYGQATDIQIEPAADGQDYMITYPDGSTRRAGGITLDDNGKQVKMTEQDIIDELNDDKEVEADEDGTLWFYYHDHKINLSDKLDEDNIAKIKVKDGLLPTYFVIHWQGEEGYTIDTSHKSFEDASK